MECSNHELLVIVDAVDHLATPGPTLEFAEMAGAQSIVLEDDSGRRVTIGLYHNEAPD